MKPTKTKTLESCQKYRLCSVERLGSMHYVIKRPDGKELSKTDSREEAENCFNKIKRALNRPEMLLNEYFFWAGATGEFFTNRPDLIDTFRSKLRNAGFEQVHGVGEAGIGFVMFSTEQLCLVDYKKGYMTIRGFKTITEFEMEVSRYDGASED